MEDGLGVGLGVVRGDQGEHGCFSTSIRAEDGRALAAVEGPVKAGGGVGSAGGRVCLDPVTEHGLGAVFDLDAAHFD